MAEASTNPKAFISYSWSSQQHQELVREWAERLLGDGIDVILDIFDLKEGDDEHAFMESMVTNPTVTHVLLFCDDEYAQKADARKAGVGTESQIISKEVYQRVQQSKFIPIACEFGPDGDACLPTFLKSRIWIDFSSPEKVNENWERLVRVLYGKPLYEKPKLGHAPAYIQEHGSAPSSPAVAKYATLRQAILQGKSSVRLYRRGFLDACIEYADLLRVRERPQVESLGEKILQDCGKLLHVRDHIIDWVLLESEARPSEDFSEALIDTLERLRDLKSRPPEVTSWCDAWFEAHALFAYETFLYIVAALLRRGYYTCIRDVLTSHYLLPQTERYRDVGFVQFDTFYASSDTLDAILAPEGRSLHSPAAELIKRQAQRNDLPFDEIIQADLLILLVAFITPDTRWYPQTMYYAKYARDFPFFLRASQHKNFKKLAAITGVDDANTLREAVKQGYERLRVDQWHDFVSHRSLWADMNMDKLDTIT